MSKNTRSKSLTNEEMTRIRASSKRLSNRIVVSFDDGLDALITRCVKRGLSDVTITYYKNELKVFRYYLADCNTEALADVQKLTALDIDKFVKYLRNVREAQTGNVNTKLKALKTYLRVNNLPKVAEHCSPLPDDKYKVKAFTTEEVNKLLNTCELSTFIGIRDYTMMLVFADAGIRVKELCNLVESDFNRQNGSLFIREAKNGYSRYAPISDEIVKMLVVLISVNPGDEYVFQSLQGRQLSRVAVQRRIQTAGKKAKLDKSTRCSPHTFRHYYAKTMVENGANVFELQKLLGHRSLEMVRVYVNLYDSHIYKAHKKYTPTNNLFRN